MPVNARAAVLREQPGRGKVQEVDLDDPGPTEVLVEVVAGQEPAPASAG